MTTGVVLRKNTAYYTGDQQRLKTRLDENFDMQYGVLANENGFEALVRALKVAEGGTDPTSLNHALKLASAAITELPNIRAGIGTDLKSVGEMENQQKNFKLFAENTVTEMKRADTIKLSALVKQEEAVLQATYATIGRLSNLSLTDYLR